MMRFPAPWLYYSVFNGPLIHSHIQTPIGNIALRLRLLPKDIDMSRADTGILTTRPTKQKPKLPLKFKSLGSLRC